MAYTDLQVAAHRGHADTVRKLLDSRVDVDARGAAGNWTALHVASGQGHIHVAEALLAASADVWAKDGDGRTPLDWSEKSRCHRTALLLRRAMATSREGAGPSGEASTLLPDANGSAAAAGAGGGARVSPVARAPAACPSGTAETQELATARCELRETRQEALELREASEEQGGQITTLEQALRDCEALSRLMQQGDDDSKQEMEERLTAVSVEAESSVADLRQELAVRAAEAQELKDLKDKFEWQGRELAAARDLRQEVDAQAQELGELQDLRVKINAQSLELREMKDLRLKVEAQSLELHEVKDLRADASRAKLKIAQLEEESEQLRAEMSEMADECKKANDRAIAVSRALGR